ncbi:hypothetical protein B5M09_005849, partial [Aphanomyces astaci]
FVIFRIPKTIEPQRRTIASSRDTTETAAGAGVGAAIGAAAWGLAAPVANAIGFGASGIAAGSTASSMMSSAAIATGGGVAAGSTVATFQSIGAVGLATPIGLGLMAAGCAVGGVGWGYFGTHQPTINRESHESYFEGRYRGRGRNGVAVGGMGFSGGKAQRNAVHERKRCPGSVQGESQSSMNDDWTKLRTLGSHTCTSKL